MEHEKYVHEALALAREAAAGGEVPVGCVIVSPDGVIVGRGRNRREELPDATAHAEVEAIRAACAALGTWNLSGCALFVTLEPCPMCAGAIINARLSTRGVRGQREAQQRLCRQRYKPLRGTLRPPARRLRGRAARGVRGPAGAVFRRAARDLRRAGDTDAA